jgi:hypothetical protein
MILAVVACCWGVHLFITGDPRTGTPVGGAFLFFAGFIWAVVVRLVSSFVTPRVIIEKDGRHAR